MQVSWNRQVLSSGYVKPSTAGSPRSSESTSVSPVQQDEVQISAEARAAYEGGITQSGESTNVLEGRATFSKPFNELNRQFDKIDQIIKTYYQEQVAEDMQFADPVQHMNDKYKNPNSPYFRWDMTEKERENAWGSEWQLYKYGYLTIADYPNNYALREAGIDAEDLNFPEMLRKSVQDSRHNIGASIKTELTDHGITLPEGMAIRLVIDPYDYYIRVEGLDDAALSEQIERVLNYGENGNNLYYTLWMSDPLKATANAATYKTGLYHVTKQLTGYDIRDMENRDGHFYLPDGRELWSVLEEAVSGMSGEQAADIGLEMYHHTYTYLGLRGWDGSPDADLNVDYMDGELRDVPDEPEQAAEDEQMPPEVESSSYGLWLLQDGAFHVSNVPMSMADLRRIAEEIRNGKAPLEETK